MLLILGFFISVSLHAGCITQDGVFLKAGFGKKAPTSWQVRKYTPFKRLAPTYKGWVYIKDFEGEKHWVEQKFFTEKYHCLIIKKDTTPIMAGPGTKYNEKFKELAEKYESFRFIKAKKGWINIQDAHGDTGWVRLRDVWID